MNIPTTFEGAVELLQNGDLTLTELRTLKREMCGYSGVLKQLLTDTDPTDKTKVLTIKDHIRELRRMIDLQILARQSLKSEEKRLSLIDRYNFLENKAIKIGAELAQIEEELERYRTSESENDDTQT